MDENNRLAHFVDETRVRSNNNILLLRIYRTMV